MNTERDKFLTEVMGECWHDVTATPYQIGGIFNMTRFSCTCGVTDKLCITNNNDFSTWNDFGKLWEWSQKQEWWEEFGDIVYHCMPTGPQRTALTALEWFIHPDRFANAVYNYLKDKSEK